MSKTPLLAVVIASAAPLVANAESTGHGFLEDSKISLSSRTLYFDNDRRDGGADQREAATGLLMRWNSGFTDGVVGFGVDAQAMVGIHLDGGRGHRPDNNNFTPSDSDGSAVNEWSRIGVNAKARISRTQLYGGNALRPLLPILWASDARLLPQSFEGGMFVSKDILGLTLTGGRLTRAIGRASSNFAGMSISGGTRGSGNFQFVGGDWNISKSLTLQYYHANLENYYNQNFYGLVHTLPLSENQSIKTDLRYFDSQSDGRNGESGYRFNNNNGYAKHPGEVNNKTWSASVAYSLSGNEFMLGHQQVSDDGGMVWMSNGSVQDGNGRNEGEAGSRVYLYTNSQLATFTRAGEQTTFGSYTYNFKGVGIPGLTFNAMYLHGSDIRDAAGGRDHSEWERDLRLDYVVQSGPLKGLGTTVRHGSIRGDGSGSIGDADQLRVIFNYTYAFK